MRIILNELKKMWTAKILVIIVVLCTVYFGLSMNDWIRWYPNDTHFGNVKFAHHLTENYGTTLSLEDFEDFLEYRNVILVYLDPFFQSNAVFEEARIFGFDDLVDFRQYFSSQYETLNDEERNLFYSVSLELGYIVRTERYGDLTSEVQTPDAYNKMTSFYNVVGLYQTNIIGDDTFSPHIDSFMTQSFLSEREVQRLAEIRDSGELKSIMSWHTLFHTLRYFQGLAALVILITLILVSALVTADRANRVSWLQYSSKQGRNILKKQFSAVLISAIGITTILVIIFSGIFGGLTGVHAFWNNGINSFMSGSFYWLSITYGQYVLLMIGIIYLLSLGTATFAFILSRFSQNMIKLIFKIIPLFAFMVMLSNWILGYFLIISAGGNVLLQMLSLIITLIVGMIAALFVIHREKRFELV